MIPFTPKYVKIAVLRADGGTSILSFCTLGRGNALTRRDGTAVSGMLWINSALGIWARPDTDANIADEVAYTDFGSPVVSWQRVTGSDALQVERDYRSALACVGGQLQHDIGKALERCRQKLREERAVELTRLDGEWMRAIGQAKKAEADAVEAERQKWRDAPADLRIDAATSVEELKQIRVA